jgi:hypothetical protein
MEGDFPPLLPPTNYACDYLLGLTICSDLFARLRWIHEGVKFVVLIVVLRLLWTMRNLLSLQI